MDKSLFFQISYNMDCTNTECNIAKDVITGWPGSKKIEYYIGSNRNSLWYSKFIVDQVELKTLMC